MINIAVFASGEGTNAENLFRYFSNSTTVKIKLVVTNNEHAGIVKKAEIFRKNIQIISRQTLEKYPLQFVEFLKSEKVDLIVLAGFLLKVPKELISAFPSRILNIHPSLLPKFGGKGMYGINVHKAVLDAGEKESGISIHFVNEHYDEGEIFLQKSCQIDENETPDSLAEKIKKLEHDCFPLAVEQVVQRIQQRTNP